MSNNKPKKTRSPFRLRAIPLAMSLLLAGGGASAGVDISSTPLLTGSAVAPNIMFVLDDSGSMQWEIMPDGYRYEGSNYLFPRPNDVYGGSDYSNEVPSFDDSNWYNYFLRSSYNNSVFYDPQVAYTPWAGYDGSNTTSYGNVDATKAPWNPVLSAKGTFNLTIAQNMSATWNSTDTSKSACRGTESCTFWPVTFYVYKGSGSTTSASSYTRYQIRGSKGYRKDLSGGAEVEVSTFDWINRSRTVAQELQNFANWFTYYRSRILAARGGASNAFAQLGTNYRVGFATINGRGSKYTYYIPTTGVFEGTNRQQWFTSLLETQLSAQGTPLRTALKWAGDYYAGKEGSDPWLPNPKVSCRQSFTILTTDGYYSDSNPGVGNSDNTAGPTITAVDGTTYAYKPANPYQDSSSETLADIAMEYWKKDLQTSAEMVNNVPTSSADPAFWQHMVTFSLSIGVQGTLDPASDLSKLKSGTKSWPSPSGNEEKIDDLWHAAVNSRGTFVAAKNPKDFGDGLRNALFTIGERVASASSVSGNSTLVSSDSLVFQGKFFSGKWTGDVVAYGFEANGAVSTTATWKASEQVPAAASRSIFTWDATTGGVVFGGGTIASLVGSTDLVNYIRGDATNEESNGGSFRTRESRLGDIVNSSPVFVGKPLNRGYERFSWDGASSYQSFREAKATRTPMVYVGANDGMLHAFDGKTGKEVFAFIPSELLSSLKSLADTKYAHRFYVDGEVQVADVYIGGAWKSILIGITGRGGKSMFAIDVTDPTTLGAGKIMWEFSNTAMGNVLSKPTVLRLNNGKWAVAVGNGYNSSGDKAQLLLVDIATGSLIKTIDTGKGGNNGLAGVGSLDANFDGNADYLYAGDILGNLWKFDVSSTSSGSWTTAYSSKPLFSAVNASGEIQAITATPTMGIHPATFEPWVFFGTGRYISSGDPSTTQVQSWYGLRDVEAISGRSKLVERKIVEQGTDALGPYRLMSRVGDTVGGESLLDSSGKFVKNGWYVDLKPPTGIATGERMFSANWWLDGLIFGASLIPSGDACSSGATGWVMAMDPWSGGRPEENVFDNSGDGKLSDADLNSVASAASYGGRSKIGRNGWQIGNGTQMYGQATDKGTVKTTGSDAGGNLTSGPEQFLGNRGRLSWREFLRD